MSREERDFDEGCLRCQHDRHVCPGCGTAQDHAGRDRQEHDPTCVALDCTCSSREIDGRTGEVIHADDCPACPSRMAATAGYVQE